MSILMKWLIFTIYFDFVCDFCDSPTVTKKSYAEAERMIMTRKQNDAFVQFGTVMKADITNETTGKRKHINRFKNIVAFMFYLLGMEPTLKDSCIEIPFKLEPTKTRKKLYDVLR